MEVASLLCKRTLSWKRQRTLNLAERCGSAASVACRLGSCGAAGGEEEDGERRRHEAVVSMSGNVRVACFAGVDGSACATYLEFWIS